VKREEGGGQERESAGIDKPQRRRRFPDLGCKERRERGVLKRRRGPLLTATSFHLNRGERRKKKRERRGKNGGGRAMRDFYLTPVRGRPSGGGKKGKRGVQKKRNRERGGGMSLRISLSLAGFNPEGKKKKEERER